MSDFLIRPYQPSDREVVRSICCETGFLGNPVDALFEDRELFADYLTRYYTDHEPQTAVVIEQEGEVSGYILGCRYPHQQRKFDAWHNLWLAARGAWRYFFKYNPASKKFVRWVLSEGRKQTPYTPDNMAHFHINLLPQSRNVAQTRELFHYFLGKIASEGVSRVFGQMVVFEERRGEAMFRRYGFQVLDRVEVTKYRDLTEQKVYLYTVYRHLDGFKALR